MAENNKTPPDSPEEQLQDTFQKEFAAARARQRERRARGEVDSDGRSLTAANRELLKNSEAPVERPMKIHPGNLDDVRGSLKAFC